MNPQLYPWIILFAPLVAAAFILFVLPRNNVAAGAIGIITAALTCFLSWKVFLDPTLAVTARETGHVKWALLQFVWMTALAYGAAAIVHAALAP